MKLGAVTLIAKDVDALAGFYADALGLEETVNDSPRFRELASGDVRIGISYQGVYALLSLEGEEEPRGLRGFMTFALDDGEAVGAVVERAVVHGATLAKAPFDTHFGQRIAVLRDPEGNVFRFSAPVPA